ncbi:hypothetical protein [Propionivibrio limicola]|uniref:hypothetical protein n=1 Tax=Propionivibrio limicola TaxID=167645 RepID=UPI001291E396|nr:hypothetical protein [Propionivibrio limicola]
MNLFDAASVGMLIALAIAVGFVAWAVLVPVRPVVRVLRPVRVVVQKTPTRARRR